MLTGAEPRFTGPVLVLGARGFLGSHIVAGLQVAGQQVRAPSGDLLAASGEDWAAWLDGAAGVINAAGRTVGSVTELARANALLPARVLEEAVQACVPLVHLSSAAEYGFVPEGQASREDDPARPLSPYGASKLAGTVLIEEAVRSGRARATALRLTNPLGAGLGAGTLPGRAARELSLATRKGRDTVRFGPLNARRDFVDARDAAQAALHTLSSLGLSDELSGVVNVGSGQARPVRDLIDLLVRLTGFQGQVLEDAPGSPRSGDVPYQCADLTRLQGSGFRPRFGLEDSLQALLNELTSPVADR